MLDSESDAPAEFHDRLTVAKAFSLAIDEAANLHPAADALITHVALLAPEPIPLFFLAEGRKELGDSLAEMLAGDGLDEALGALRAFALIDREVITDERDPRTMTDTVRLHRLVREIAAARCEGEAREEARRRLLRALEAIYPYGTHPTSWPRARRLDALALALVEGDTSPLTGTEVTTIRLLNRVARYRHEVLLAYPQAQRLYERALNIALTSLRDDDPETATTLHNYASLRGSQGDHVDAEFTFRRALEIREKMLGSDHPDTAVTIAAIGDELASEGCPSMARPFIERALAIKTRLFGPEHPQTASAVNALANLLWDEGDLGAARPLYERALAIYEKHFGPEDGLVAQELVNLAALSHKEGDLIAARPLYERALAIQEKAYGDHVIVGRTLSELALLMRDQGDFAAARALYERSLLILGKTFGPDRTDSARLTRELADMIEQQGDLAEARLLYERALAIYEKALRPDHPVAEEVRTHLRALLARTASPGLLRQVSEWAKRRRSHRK
jgi:tetratricopeptide (TPR) repeat protein